MVLKNILKKNTINITTSFILLTLKKKYLFISIKYFFIQSKKEFNGIETYIWEKLKANDNSWFPIEKAIGLNSEMELEKGAL